MDIDEDEDADNDDEPDWAAMIAAGSMGVGWPKAAKFKARSRRKKSAQRPAQSNWLDTTTKLPTPARQPRAWAADMPPTGTIAGVTFPRSQIRATISLLTYYRDFLASDFELCLDPEDRLGVPMTKALARYRLGWLINVAINRKAGIPDVACRKQETDYETRIARDCRGVRDAVNRRARAWGRNGRRWETDEIQRRYGYLLDGD